MDFQVNQADNTGIFPQFFIEPKEHKAKSLEAGRPIFVDQEYVRIVIAGDSKSSPVHKVNQSHIDRWPDHYRAFKQGHEAPIEGTPLNQWPSISASQAAELKALNIHTVEALAQLPDTGIQRIGMGGRELVKKAVAFLEAAKDTAAAQKYAAENERLRNDVEMLQQQIKELASLIDEKTSPDDTPKRGPGRPPKN